MSNELEVQVEEATIENTQIGDTVFGIYQEEDSPEEEYYFGRVFSIDTTKQTFMVDWEYDENDINHIIDLEEINISDVYKLVGVKDYQPIRKMPKAEDRDILSQFK